MDRKIVEYLVMGKPHRWIKEQLGVGAGRLAKVQALAEAHGYLSGQAMPAYPQALFADRTDRRSEQRSAADAGTSTLQISPQHRHLLWTLLAMNSPGWEHIFVHVGAAPNHAAATTTARTRSRRTKRFKKSPPKNTDEENADFQTG